MLGTHQAASSTGDLHQVLKVLDQAAAYGIDLGLVGDLDIMRALADGGEMGGRGRKVRDVAL